MALRSEGFTAEREHKEEALQNSPLKGILASLYDMVWDLVNIFVNIV